MSAATVIWVDRLSFASSSVGTFLDRLGNEVGYIVQFSKKSNAPFFPSFSDVSSVTDELHMFKLADTCKDLVP